MKKKIWIFLILSVAVVLLLVILLVPKCIGPYFDGGTREYRAPLYTVVHWHCLEGDGIYEKVRVFVGPDRKKTIDELWEIEKEFIERTFIGTILELSETSAIVEPAEGERVRHSATLISFGITDLAHIGARVGDVVEVTYRGDILETCPAQIGAVEWKKVG